MITMTFKELLAHRAVTSKFVFDELKPFIAKGMGMMEAAETSGLTKDLTDIKGQKLGPVEFWFDYTWAICGFPVFQLTDSLTSSLILTDSSDIPWKEIEKPYAALMLLAPVALLYPDRDLTEDQAFLQINSVADPETEALVVDIFSNTKEIPREAILFKIKRDGSGDSYDVQPKAANKVFLENLIKGFFLWLMTKPPQHLAKKPTAITKKQKTLYRQYPSVWELGREVKLAPELREMVKNDHPLLAGGSAPGWKLKRQFVVRGHFRNQACGKGLKDRKTIYVQPYWKGPDVKEAIAHLYKVSE